jgi:hypothetical protein
VPGVSIEDISRLVGQSITVVTETIYRKELRPVLTRGAEAMDPCLRPRQDEAVDRQPADLEESSSAGDPENPG